MRHSKSKDLQCSSLNNLHRYHARDLFSSHAKRIGSTKQEVVELTCKSYQPRSCPVTPYSTPRPQYNPNTQSKSKKANEIADQLKWLRAVSNQTYQAPTTYSSFSRPSSRYSKYSVKKSLKNQFTTNKHKRYKRPLSSTLTYRAKQKTQRFDAENRKSISRPQTAKIMLSNKMLSIHRNHKHHSSTNNLNADTKNTQNSTDFTLSAWTLKDKGKRSFVFDHPNDTTSVTETQEIEPSETIENKENEEIMNDETRKRKQKPKMDALDINSIDSQTENFKHWRVPKNPLNHNNSISSIDIDSEDNEHYNNQINAYLTNIEREQLTTRSVLQHPRYTDHLYTDRPKSIPCQGIKFSDFEQLKLNLSKSGIRPIREEMKVK